MQIKLWPKNEKGLRQLAAKDPQFLNPTRVGNFAIAYYLTSKRKNPKRINKSAAFVPLPKYP